MREAVRLVGHLLRRRVLTPGRIRSVLSSYMAARRGAVTCNRPPILMIDPTMTCQLRCTGCATGVDPAGHRSRMPLEDFKGLVDDVAQSAMLVGLYRQGEPFLHPELLDMIDYLDSKRIACWTSTNGERIGDPRQLERLVRSGLYMLIVSVSGTTEEEHSRYHRGGSLRKVRNNLMALRQIRNRLGSSTPRVRIRFLTDDPNLTPADLDGFRCSMHADDLDVTLREDMIGPRTIPLDAEPSGSGESCLWPWMVSVISADGTMNQCCQAPRHECYDLGDAHAPDGFAAAWNGPDYQRLRKAIRSGRDSLVACRDCPARLGLS